MEIHSLVGSELMQFTCLHGELKIATVCASYTWMIDYLPSYIHRDGCDVVSEATNRPKVDDLGIEHCLVTIKMILI